MCGIAGIYEQNGHKVSLEILETIGNLMVHRGPDNFSFSQFGEHVGLSHNRLSLLDLSAAANQPFKNNDYAIVFNGEIYNFREIKAHLEKSYGITFHTTSDTEVLFYSLIHDGIDECLRRLRGMFAFAFYDKKNEEVIIARDRYGIKPLYYADMGSAFFWSSEIKALATTLNLKPDPLKTLFSINGSAERSRVFTVFDKIKPVKPGTYLRIGRDSKRPRETVYYSILDDFEPERYRELEGKSKKEILSEFETLLTESISSMLISDAPLGAFVSGGIDSSLISAVAKRLYPNLKLFTANVLGKFSEVEDARALSGHLNSELFEHKFEPEMMLSEWADVTYFYECPIVIHTNAIPFSGVARLARESNVKAVLTGEGADELFLGYPKLLAQRYNRFALIPSNVVRSLYKIVPGLDAYLFPNQAKSTTEFAKQIIQEFESSMQDYESSGKLEFLTDRARREQLFTLDMIHNHLVTLLHRNDRMGMMASIEARFPFLHEDLVKFAINLPSKFKIGHTRHFYNYKHPFLMDKWVIRKTAEKYLPERLTTKKKNGFPMIGHKFVKVRHDFFKNGWLADNLSFNSKSQQLMSETQDPYFIAKLASVEIFGRLFGSGENVADVKNHVLKNTEMIKA
ncbi:MAG: asparagine synthase (glutamine-hydrolyzing) [Blastocatellia bacterium]